MATLCHFVLAPSRLGHNSSRTLLKPWSTQSFIRVLARASSASLTVTEPDVIRDDGKVTANRNVLACPICYEPFDSVGGTQLSVNTSAQSSFHCCTGRKEYFGNETHLNLTVASGSSAYDESMPASTEIFRTPVVSFLYERGWRQTFSVLGGFPGAQKEFQMMKDYLKPVLGGNIIDASCGSGMFSRLFAKSGLFSRVVALDFSENMLQECFKFIKEEENFPTENLILVRADISRLPFATSSIDAVHAGAALHCWPSPSAAVAEVSRVLRPGGVFVATTYILDGLYSLIPLLGSVRQIIGEVSGSHIFLSEGELKDLCATCGLLDFTVVRNRRFVMISARKPS
ncbi:Major facilitator superfamily protein [Heracleum sosnowskyi]|uniref:Major facilitator superfamily protein n=1 Tax=Heracleum sosnowskyi TaxID=360622 RepID=A0AAD8N0F1_9APIA|nr:Major facilitator superfamily protein [Heracleum sosnowskyi]